jgi:hypothetical protein
MRKKSNYRPRPIIRDTLHFVTTGFKPMTLDQQLAVAVQQHDAMRSLTHGTGTKGDWEIICELMNTGIALDQTVYGGSHRLVIQLGMTAHAKCAKRYQTGGAFGYSGEELTAVNDAIEVHREQLRLSTMAEIGDALRVVDQAKRQGNYFISARHMQAEAV